VRRLSKVTAADVPTAPTSAKSGGKAASGAASSTSTKPPASAASHDKATVTSLPEQAGSEDAARRAG